MAPPGFPSHAFKPKPKIQKPIWAMTEQELLAVARGQAEAAYKPELDALQRSRREQTSTYQAAQAGLAKLIEALQSGTTGYADQIAKIFSDAQNAVAGYSDPQSTTRDVTQTMLSGEGAAYAGADKAQSQLIGNEGQTQYLTAVQEQNKALRDLADQEATLRAKIPGATQQALDSLHGSIDDYVKANKPVLKTIGGSLYAINPNDPRQMVLLKKGAEKPVKVNLSLSKALGQWVDSSGRPVKGINKPVPAPDAKTPKIALDLSRQLGYWADSTGAPIPGVPGSPVKKPGPKKTVTAEMLRNAREAIYTSKGRWADVLYGKPLSFNEVKALVDEFNKRQIASGAKTTKNGKTVKWADNPVTVAELSHLSPDDLKDIGLVPHEDFQTADDVYLQIVRSGIPARRAWAMVRKAYPEWGEGYFDGPKGKAAAQTAAYSGDYAVPGQGKIIGTPYSGTHTLGNWESDNAVDVAMPVGTPLYATEDGVIGSQFGPLNSSNPRMAGLRLHLQAANNEFYYAHLSRFAPGIQPGAHVKKGQLIGYSGSANGTAHLHFGMRTGNPMTVYGSAHV